MHTDAYSVSRACATSLQSTANISEAILSGQIKIGIAGGADSVFCFAYWRVKKTCTFFGLDLKRPKLWPARFKVLSQLSFT